MSNRTSVKWGIIGAGRIAHTFARDMPYAKNAELVAVAAREQGSAEEFAAKYQIEKFYGGYEKLLIDSEVDAVYIATPHTEHQKNCIDALNASKAVLCEKPLTITPDQCQDIIDRVNEIQFVSQRDHPFVMEAMWTFFLPAIRRAQSWIAEGRIGKLRHVKADFGYPVSFNKNSREYSVDLAGGCLLDMGIYPLAFAWLFVQQLPKNISVVSHLAPNGVEDDVLIQCEYDEQCATLATSFRCKLPNWAYLIGDEGYIAIPDFWRASECSLYRLDERVAYFEDRRYGSGFEFEIQHASEQILQGKSESDIVSLKTSLEFQNAIAAVRNEIELAKKNSI